MLKPTMLKLVRKEEEHEEDRGANAPVLLARPNRLARRLGQASRGYVLAGAGVVVAAVGFVSFLSWLAPDSDRPVGHPLEVVGQVADGLLEQVDDQVAALLGAEGETVLRDVRENLTAVGSRIPGSGRTSEITPDRSSASSGPSSAATPTTRPTLNTPAQEEPSSSATSEPPQSTYAPSPSSTSETPPAAEPQPPAPTSEPTPPPATEEPPAPPVEEPLPPIEEPPPAEEPSTPPVEEPPPAEEQPPIEEVPPPTGPPPTTDEPAPPAPEEPSPTTEQPQPTRPPTGPT